MAKFVKRPVVIEAILWDGSNPKEVLEFLGRSLQHLDFASQSWARSRITIPTLEGDMFASVGDWIIKGIKGEFYPCKPDIFAATYEAVEEVVS